MPGLLPAVIFPDVELWLTTYLRTELTARSESARVGANRIQAARWVWIRRDGGPRLDATREAARITINVGADGPTGQPVNDLAQLVRALVGACPSGPVKRATELSGPSPVDDATGQPRRVMAFELIVAGSDLPAP
jgi:hypothetical protein